MASVRGMHESPLVLIVIIVVLVDVASACDADSSGHFILAVDTLLNSICSFLDQGKR